MSPDIHASPPFFKLYSFLLDKLKKLVLEHALDCLHRLHLVLKSFVHTLLHLDSLLF